MCINISSKIILRFDCKYCRHETQDFVWRENILENWNYSSTLNSILSIELQFIIIENSSRAMIQSLMHRCFHNALRDDQFLLSVSVPAFPIIYKIRIIEVKISN